METSSSSSQHSRASGRSVAIIVVVLVLLFAGDLPVWLDTARRKSRRRREPTLKLEATTLPTVTITIAARAASVVELTLPGNIQAITEAAVLARAEGYLVKRYVDIGDRVQ